MKSPLLTVDELHLTIQSSKGASHLLRGVSFSIFPGEIVGLVGESGSGKSLCAHTILGLLPPYCLPKGTILFREENLLKIQKKELSLLRGNQLGLILQDPSSALNPLLRIGTQLKEGLRLHKGLSDRESTQEAIEWLKKVGIQNPEEKMRVFPHQLSGGMKQRVVIAMVLSCGPSLVIADEPTTALDVTTQREVLKLLQSLQREMNTSILFITHDLSLAANYCDRLIVMYAGQVVEVGETHTLLQNPKHPYTAALLKSKISLESKEEGKLYSLQGSPPHPRDLIKGCAFAPRCAHSMPICRSEAPAASSSVRCWISNSENSV